MVRYCSKRHTWRGAVTWNLCLGLRRSSRGQCSWAASSAVSRARDVLDLNHCSPATDLAASAHLGRDDSCFGAPFASLAIPIAYPPSLATGSRRLNHWVRDGVASVCKLEMPARAHSSSCSLDSAPSTPQAPSISPPRRIGNPPRTWTAGSPSPATALTVA